MDEFKPPIEVGFKAGLCMAIANIATLELTGVREGKRHDAFVLHQ